MNPLSRTLVLLSLLAATALEAHLAVPEYGPLIRHAFAAFVLGLIAGVAAPRAGMAVALALAYVAPVLLSVLIGRFRLSYLLIWIAMLEGVLAASRPWRGWAIPSRWSWPLVTWALVVSTTWPLVLWRETDFDFGMLHNTRMVTTQGGLSPAIAALGILDSAVTQLLGLLWFDWLYHHYHGQPASRFSRLVIAPLAIGAVLSSLLGVYQGTVDLSFWSAGQWPFLRRAAGGLLDANGSGTVAASWAAIFFALFASRCYGRPASIAAAAGAAVACASVWTSGSRTASLATLLGVGWVVAILISRLESRKRAILTLSAVLIVLSLGLTALPVFSVGPLQRLRAGIQQSSAGGAAGIVRELWHRDAYGTASTQVIRENPMFGAGVGAFALLSVDYARLTTGANIPHDNAQNWFRHQIAELGFVGSAGCLAWSGLLGLALTRVRHLGQDRLPAEGARGALLGLGAASMLGVPTQVTAVTVTFWTLAFWYLSFGLAAEQDDPPARNGATRHGVTWTLVAVLATVSFAGTLYTGWHHLNVPARAHRFGWNYEHGFYEPQSADGQRFRYTHQRTAAVMDKAGRRLSLRLWTDDPSAATDAVAAKVWIDGRLVLDTPLTYGTPVTLRVPLLLDGKKMLIRMWVERTWRQQTAGGEARDVGLTVGDWTFDN